MKNGESKAKEQPSPGPSGPGRDEALPLRDLAGTRVAIIGIIVENQDAVDRLNTILHDYSEIIIGRMGLPYRKKNISIISIAVDAPQDVISALSGKLGRLGGVAVKTAYSSV